VRATSWRQWLGFGLFVVVLVGAIVIAVGWFAMTFVVKSCGSC
jgi:hypothetical protein